MQNLLLHIDGPVTVSDLDFAHYQNLPLPRHHSFDYLYYIWIDAHYSDGFRRLALRDLLRQGHYYPHRESLLPFYRTDENFTHLLHIGDNNKPRDLYWQLHNRPDLLAMFTEEFTYALQESKLPIQQPSDLVAQDDLLEIIFRLSDETAWTCLSPYYNLWDPKHRRVYHSADRLIETWSRCREPAWFAEHLDRIVTSSLSDELLLFRIQPSDLTSANLHSFAIRYESALLLAVFQFIEKQLHKPQAKRNTPAIIHLLDTITEHLPAHFCLFSYNALIPLLYDLDPDIALRYVRRHLISGYSNGIDQLSFRDALHFFYWLRGLISFTQPDDASILLDHLDELYEAALATCDT